MKILVIGDPHGNLKKIKKIPLKDVDLILLTGDLGKAELARKMAFENINRAKKGLPEKEYTSKQKKRSYIEAYESTLKLMKYLSKVAPVYTIFGNVEMTDKEIKEKSKQIGLKLPLLTKSLKKIKNVKIINDKKVDFKGIKIAGLNYFVDTSWVKEFKPEWDKKKVTKVRKKTKKIHRILNGFGKVDILISHQPPFGVLDRVNFPGAPKHWQGKHAGSKAVLNFIKSKHPRYVFCGHIHEAKGKRKIGKTEIYNVGVGGDFLLLNLTVE